LHRRDLFHNPHAAKVRQDFPSINVYVQNPASVAYLLTAPCASNFQPSTKRSLGILFAAKHWLLAASLAKCVFLWNAFS